MRALTIYQPWASLILCGAKIIEWRTWPLPRSRIDEPIVLHAGSKKRPTPPALDLIRRDLMARNLAGVEPTQRAIELLVRMASNPDRIAYGGLGVVAFSEATRDGDAAWAWPVRVIEIWDKPVERPGAQQFWTWEEPHDADQSR